MLPDAMLTEIPMAELRPPESRPRAAAAAAAAPSVPMVPVGWKWRA